MDVVLYGRLDALKAGTIYDIKFSKGYERGKFYSSTQHPTYMLLIPEAQQFSYLVSNGMDVWTEEDMKMLYTEKEKNEIERVRKVFEKHIQQMTAYDLVWSDKVGYVWLAISIDPTNRKLP